MFANISILEINSQEHFGDYSSENIRTRQKERRKEKKRREEGYYRIFSKNPHLGMPRTRSTTVSSTKFKTRERGRAGGIPRFWGIPSKKACAGAGTGRIQKVKIFSPLKLLQPAEIALEEELRKDRNRYCGKSGNPCSIPARQTSLVQKLHGNEGTNTGQAILRHHFQFGDRR